MRKLNKINLFILVSFCFFGALQLCAQDTTISDNPDGFTTIQAAPKSEPTLLINEDPKIAQLLAIKTEMDKNGTLSNSYRIQLYNGTMNQAQKVLKKAEALFPQWKTDFKWETPEFKVWIGNYRSKLERDRALREIKKEFPAAFSPQSVNN